MNSNIIVNIAKASGVQCSIGSFIESWRLGKHALALWNAAPASYGHTLSGVLMEAKHSAGSQKQPAMGVAI